MKILIRGIDEALHISINYLTSLFFENTTIVFNKDNTNIDLQVTFSREEKNDELVINGALIDQKHEEIHHSHTGKIPSNIIEKKKTAKRYHQLVYLSLLEKYTNKKQPWGTLTGIRPTKLMHSKILQGKSIDETKTELIENYSIENSKVQLMETIVDQQMRAVPDLYHLTKGVSIYIGIPFCPTKCAYCTFPAYAIQGKQGNVNSFLEALHLEMELIGTWLKKNNIPITTIYFGGGTPSSISAMEMDKLYEKMYDVFPFMDQVREITVEAGRPDTITVEKLNVLKKWKIDRISINPQSFIQDTLVAIGRHHTVQETIDAFLLARSMGMNNINMDLIIGLPGEGLKEFQYTLSEIEKLMPESLTVHTLSYKRASEMTHNREKYPVATLREIVRMMEEAQRWMQNHNYLPYYLYRQKNILGNLENIGYSLQGNESLYNIIIMEEKQTIIGLGCGAASKLIDPHTGKITRYANPKEPKIFSERFPKYVEEKIDILKQLFE